MSREFTVPPDQLVPGDRFANERKQDAILEALGGLHLGEYDYVDVASKNSNGDPTSIVYKLGGAGGITVATLTVTYDTDGDLKTITKS